MSRHPHRIVFVSPTDELGGADTSLFELVRALDRRRFEPHVVLPQAGPFADRYRELGVAVHVVPLHKLKSTLDPRWQLAFLLRAPLRVVRLWRLFRRLSPAVVHVNSTVEPLAALAARLCARPGRCRLVWHVRELECGPRVVARTLHGLVRRLADTVVAISTPIARRFGRRERVYVIPNGLDVVRFRAAAEGAAGERAGCAPPVVGWVGRLARGKGLDRVLDAFALVRAQLPDARLVVMGADVRGHEEHAAALRRRAAELGDAVEWLPAGPDPERAYSRMHVFVHLPEVEEGLGRTVLEAQASSVPVVAWPRGGLAEALRDGETGVLVPPGDVAAAAAAIVALLTDGERRARFAAAAGAFAAATFTRERCARAVERVYEELLT